MKFLLAYALVTLTWHVTYPNAVSTRMYMLADSQEVLLGEIQAPDITMTLRLTNGIYTVNATTVNAVGVESMFSDICVFRVQGRNYRQLYP